MQFVDDDEDMDDSAGEFQGGTKSAGNAGNDGSKSGKNQRGETKRSSRSAHLPEDDEVSHSSQHS